jgi:hypothetical protein
VWRRRSLSGDEAFRSVAQGGLTRGNPVLVVVEGGDDGTVTLVLGVLDRPGVGLVLEMRGHLC